MQRRSIFLLFLLGASLVTAQEKTIALKGTVVTPDQVIPNGVVLVQDGVIREVGAEITIPPDATVVDTGGVIAPGLVDLHNHLTWNVFPRWKPIEEFDTRYDWQKKPIYQELMNAPHQALMDEGLECDAERYAEVKAITEGETSVVGSSHRAECNGGLARNLDGDAELGKQDPPKVIYEVFPLRMTPEKVADAQKNLSSGGTLLIHLAEGAPKSAAAEQEFAALQKLGLLRPGVSLIHAVALTPADFLAMHQARVGFVWSPRSNLELYGGTADVTAALAAHVVTALAPDWSPTGSDGLLGELQYAAVWNATQGKTPPLTDHELVDMSTTNAAALVHADKILGRIEKGYAADLLVLRPHGQAYGKDAWWSLDHSSPADVELVVIGGAAVYGDPGLMHQLAGTKKLETLTICGAEKRISFASEPGSRPTFAETEARLDTALREWGRNLAPLAECGQ